MDANTTRKVGSWTFVFGIVLAVVMGFFGTATQTTWALAVLGLFVGIINVTQKESQLFLIAAIAFLVSASSLTLILEGLGPFLRNVIVFVGPGTAVVALRALYDVSKDV